MPNPKIIRIINSILTLIILIGCDNIRQDKQETALEATLSTYQSAMRWGYWDALLSFFNTPVAPETLTNLDNVRVTAYEIRQPTILVTKDKALQIIEIQYILNSDQRLRKTIDRQEWHYDPNQKTWRIFSPFPTFE